MNLWADLPEQQQQQCWWPCCGCTAVDLPMTFNGEVSTGDGRTTSTESYSIAGDAWSAEGNLSGRKAFSFTHDDCYIYSLGGDKSGTAFMSETNKFYKSTKAWAADTAYPNGLTNIRIGGGDMAPASNGINVFGGIKSGSTFTTEHRALSSGSWSTLTATRLSVSRSTEAPGDGYVYLISGVSSTPSATSNVDQYDPSGDSFAAKTAMTATRGNAAGVTDFSDKIAIIGGLDSGAAWTKKVYLYSISGDSWATKTDCPSDTSHAPGMSAPSNTYVVAGQSDVSTIVSSLREYSISGDSWASRANTTIVKTRVGAAA